MDGSHPQKLFAAGWWALAFLWWLGSGGGASASANTFHHLLQEKSELENRFGVQTVECFPFVEDIGFNEDQIRLVDRCLAALQTLKSALAEVERPEVVTIGISTRFLRTGGFHTVLIPWDAPREEITKFLSRRVSLEEQRRFLDKIFSLKRTVLRKIPVAQLYCSQKISNEECYRGYETLALVEPPGEGKRFQWREIVITDTHAPQKDPYTLALGFADSAAQMQAHIRITVDEAWASRKRMYERMEEKYSRTIKKRLQIENLICAPTLTAEECMQGAANLYEASENPVLQAKAWGVVRIDRYNTLIHDDFHVTLRYDLPPEAIVERFSRKADRAQATRDSVLAKKLEGRTKNNPTRLRVVCDLGGLRSDLCARSFQTFIKFVEGRRDYRVRKPWTELMFIDGTQLARVNFALNSPVRKSYLYLDANSDREEFESYLLRFGGEETVSGEIRGP